MSAVVFNTSNPGKQRELQRLFAVYGYQVNFTSHDLPEIQADCIDVVVHKACQVPEGVLVEDVSLDIPGEKVGVDVRWLIDEITRFIGKKACWKVLLAQYTKGKVYVYAGQIHGSLVQKRESSRFGSFGFDPYFIPKGYTKTLAVEKPDACNARALAVEAFVTGKKHATHKALWSWQGPWQNT